tara:strand:+ start:7099 stop:8088 length:990 start_codon:yes stop_codon:yes gene_type:complete
VPEDLTPNEKLMDTNDDDVVSKKERKEFKRSTKRETIPGKLGLSYALITQLSESTDPDAVALSQFFNQLTTEYFDNPTGFNAEAAVIRLETQPWMQKYKKTAIQDMDFAAQYPELYEQDLSGRMETLRDQAVQYGATVTEDQLRDLAVQARRMNMNASELNNTLSNYVAFDSGNIQGSAGMAQRNIKAWALKNGLQLTDNMINGYAKNIISGNTTQDDVLQDLRNTYLVGSFPAWSDRIKAGMDPADIAAPYKQRMARLLEVDESQIDLNDQLLQQAMQGVGNDGKPSVVPLYSFDQQIKKDDRWQYTENAMDTYAKTGTKILQMFGLR